MGRVEPNLASEPWMRGPERPKLTHAEVVETGVLRLTWTDGNVRNLDLRGKLQSSKSALVRSLMIPEVFPDFEVEQGGHGLRWINGVDFCCDALRMQAEAQVATKEEETI